MKATFIKMKMMIIGANGRLGRLLTDKAVERGHEVIALSPSGMENTAFKGEVLKKSLFDLTKEDIVGLDAVLSSFGGGFEADPAINRQAVDHLIRLIGEKNIRLLTVGGAGTLWTDRSHTMQVWQTPEHPEFLRGISKNLTLALEDLRMSCLKDWTFLCPSLLFDYEGSEMGEWKIGTDGEPLKNRDGVSRISYRDFASAMISEAENGEHKNHQITVCEV